MTYRDIRLAGFAVSWAGANPYGMAGFCFGSEDGRVMCTDVSGRIIGKVFVGAKSREAVNGVAVVNSSLAVSTRADVSVLIPLVGRRVLRTATDQGAHGVRAGRRHFYSPAGPAGLIELSDRPGAETGRLLGQTESIDPPDFYQVAVVRRRGQRDLIVCALRRRGLGVLLPSATIGSGTLYMVNHPGLDIIDVCLVGPPGRPAVVALARNGTLVHAPEAATMYRSDAPRDRWPMTSRFDDVTGTAYRVVSCQGHLVVLTSTGLHILFDWVSQFTRGLSAPPPGTFGQFIAVEAADIGVAENRYLLAVTADGVRVFDMRLIDSADAGGRAAVTARPANGELVRPTWETSDVPRSSLALQVN